MTQQQMTIDQAIDLAIQQHTAGQVQAAANIYRQVLAIQPNSPDALHLLGLVVGQQGDFQQAIDLIRKAIASAPGSAPFHANLGQMLLSAGRTDEAIAAYRQAIVFQPDPAAQGMIDVFNNLGAALHHLGQVDEAIAILRQAVAVRPDYPDLHLNLGNTLHTRGQLDESIAEYRAAASLAPTSVKAHSNLGAALREKGDVDRAIESLRRAIELDPNYPEAHNNLGMALKDKKQNDFAMASYRKALELRLDYPEAHNNLGELLQSLGQLDEAAAEYRIALKLRPNYIDAHNNLGSSMIEAGHLDDADETFQQALAIAPEHPIVHFNIGLVHLIRGDMRRGLPEVERYWGTTRAYPFPGTPGRPQWNGEDPGGRTILLFSEQGFGDTIQLIRYVPLVAQRGGRVIVATYPDLIELVRSMRCDMQIVPINGPEPRYDLQASLVSLPLIMGTTVQTIPADVPYLHADPTRVPKWRDRLGRDKFNVGLVWAGRPEYRNDRNRSMPLEALAPLAKVEGVRLISLQKSPVGSASADRLLEPNPDRQITGPLKRTLLDWTDELYDFADTAALIDQLDLIISVDTAVAHLAGALAKPVWMLIPFMPDWRWMLDRTDTPWYPTMRLFRQAAIGDWASAICQVTEALRSLVQAR